MCVSGVRKWTLRTRTVTQILENNELIIDLKDSVFAYLKVSRIIVKSTNFPRRGTTSEVGGIISASSKKNTVRERRMLIERLT